MKIITDNVSLKVHIQILTSIIIFGLLTSCQSLNERRNLANPSSGSQAITTSAKRKVVVTNTVLCDLTKQVAGDTIDLVCLMSPGSDPHIYKLTSADRQSIETAKLIMYGGYNLEPELIKAIQSSSSSVPKVAVAEVAIPQPQQFVEDGSKTIDPHVWHDARNGVKLARVIESRLAKLVPAQSRIYQQNTQKLTAELTQLDNWMRSQVNTIPIASKVLVTTHDSLSYYAKAYGLKIATLEGISTDEKPNAARVKALILQIKQTQVPTIFAESTLNPQLIKLIAREANVKISAQQIYADGLGAANSSGATYQQMLIANTHAIVSGLGGKYTPFIKVIK
jgi:manganese/iron transport system substrate-binding protein